jgi:hypothetical protein
VLLGDGTATGEVVLPDGTHPAAFSVDAAGDDGDAVPGAAGRFALTLPAGEHTLTIAGPTFLTTHLERVKVGAGARTDVGKVVVQAGRSVSGRVLGPDGAPVPGAQVVAGRGLSGGGARLMIPTESIAFQETVSGEDGRFTLAGLHEQALVVMAEREDVGRSPSIPLPPGLRAEVELRLAPTGTLAGRATRDGLPFADTVVIATPQLGRSNFFVVSGPDGRYAFDRLSPGAYQLVVFLGRSKDMLMRPVEVTAGHRTEADLEVTTGPATLGVRVDAGGGGARVMLISGSHQVPPGATAETMLDLLRPREPTTMYMREAKGAAPALFEGLTPGPYTACTAVVPPGRHDPGAGPGGGPLRCVTRDVAGSTELALDAPAPAR